MIFFSLRRIIMTVSLTLKTLAGLPAVEIKRTGCQPTTFVSNGSLPFGAREAEVRLVQGVPFKGDWEAARAALA